MNTASTSASTTAPDQATAPGRDRSRFWAGLAAALFPAACIAAGVVLLSSVQVSGCITYGVQCTRGLPGWLFVWSTGTGAVAFIVALAARALQVRQAALTIQLLAECTALAVILSYYA
ncbi:hypothetical protein PV721_02355 [Streptomyces sp. MB09-01]|uniref:hypothetical protein n=1 Tax=Streptomyces sp. MB09-01 TaxID=3028666 RepID=UPI0029A6732F|nr:hypothetical protein [Streptomyces sp. MB09-01]MDX3533228.1 hypothetical protein [Streptomyces sp. MB09-01]